MKVSIQAYSWLASRLGERGPGPLRLAESAAEGETLRDLLRRLAARDPAFAEAVFDPVAGLVREQVNVIVNGRVFELIGGLDAHLHDGDEIVLLPAYSGGS